MKSKPIINQAVWEKFVLSRPQANFLQSWNWGQFHQALGKKIFRLGFYQAGQLIGVALLIKEPARRGVHLTCSGGPLLDNHQTSFEFFITTVKVLAKKEGAIFIRLRPQVLNTLKNQQWFKARGFVAAPMHLHAETTWQLDLRPSPEELLMQMRKTTRQAIKKALQAGVEINITNEPEAINRLYDLQIETVKRAHFIPFAQEFLSQQWQIFKVADQARIFEARHRGQIVASAMIIFYGQEAVYHYSGSSVKAREINASHLLQWEAIQEAKQRGCRRYNFWGIAPEDKPKHRFQGVTVFKKGFGGFPVNYLHAQDLPLNLRYWLIYVFETSRRLTRRL
ncbi:aminoacyltransferase [Patescibacteria group bacterium]|nr:aminoacyltransferase [Patescibacteria group bacterium]MBU1931755.1 aminoacyltransferase [Patescibacteria group bacterium]